MDIFFILKDRIYFNSVKRGSLKPKVENIPNTILVRHVWLRFGVDQLLLVVRLLRLVLELGVVVRAQQQSRILGDEIAIVLGIHVLGEQLPVVRYVVSAHNENKIIRYTKTYKINQSPSFEALNTTLKWYGSHSRARDRSIDLRIESKKITIMR